MHVPKPPAGGPALAQYDCLRKSTDTNRGQGQQSQPATLARTHPHAQAALASSLHFSAAECSVTMSAMLPDPMPLPFVPRDAACSAVRPSAATTEPLRPADSAASATENARRAAPLAAAADTRAVRAARAAISAAGLAVELPRFALDSAACRAGSCVAIVATSGDTHTAVACTLTGENVAGNAVVAACAAAAAAAQAA